MSTAAGATVFLFSDIEGSTRLWEQQPAPMADALARHDAIVRRAVAAWGGRLVKGTGDGIHATFDAAPAALGATLQLQRGLADAAAAGALPLAVRCGLHAGPSQARDADHFGPEVNRAARIMAVAHGGQVLLSQVVADVLAGALPAGVALKDLGSVRLKDLAQPERLWQVLAPPLRTDFPPLRGLDATPNNLAQQLNRFIGREAVLPALHTLLGQYRLVTLLGTGGIGKSRLAMQLGAELLDAYPDGVWCVELAPLHDGLRLPQAVASVLGVREAPGRPLLDALCQHVASRRLLLILDNCEHVLDSAATLAKALLQASAGLRVLATSREVLRVAGELSFPVPPLGLPAPEAAAQSGDLLQHEAVRLFVDRARSAQPTFVLDAATAPAVVAICRQLDGIALALELAAARVRTLPVQAIAERLRGSFALLGTRDATVAPRQRSLQLLIDWSHDLLAPEERVLYRRLAVFAGGWTLELAEGVCADGSIDGHAAGHADEHADEHAGCDLPGDAVLDLLSALVEKSLVAAQPGAVDREHHYRLLDTVRQHAAARLAAAEGDAAALRRRHATAHLALAEAAQRQLAGVDKASALARLDHARENLGAALDWCAQDTAPDAARLAAETGLRLSFALRPYWLNRGLLSLGLQTSLRLLTHPGAVPRDGLRARGLFNAGQLCCFMGRNDQAMPLLLECLAIAREAGDTAREAAVLQPLGMAAIGLGDRVAARQHMQAALAAAQRIDNPRQLASAWNALAQLDRLDGRLVAAQASYQAFLALSRALQDQEYVAAALLNLAMVAVGRGDAVGARGLLPEVMTIADAIGSRPAALGAIDVAAALAGLDGDAKRAAQWHGLAQVQYHHAGLQRDAADEDFVCTLLVPVRQALGAGFELAVAEGAAQALDPAWATLRHWLSHSG